MKNTEVEQKFALPEPDTLRQHLGKLGAVQAGTSRQIDVYYNHPCRDFLGHDVVSEWLRLRRDEPESGPATASINFKQWLPLHSPEATHAREYESALSNPEAVSHLLEALGFIEIVTVTKNRERWKMPTPSGAVEIAIDEVEDLGGFVEFEYDADGDLDQTANALTHAVKSVTSGGIDLSERDRRGYPYLLLDRKR